MKRPHWTLVAFALTLLLGSHVILRAQRTVSAEDLIDDMDHDLKQLIERFARDLHHQGEGRLGQNETHAFILVSAFAGEIHGLDEIFEESDRAQIPAMLQLIDGTFVQADRAVRRAHVTARVTREWAQNAARYQALRQAYNCSPFGQGHSRPYR